MLNIKPGDVSLAQDKDCGGERDPLPLDEARLAVSHCFKSLAWDIRLLAPAPDLVRRHESGIDPLIEFLSKQCQTVSSASGIDY